MAPSKGRFDVWKCTQHPPKGHGVSFEGMLHCRAIVPAKTQCIAPKEGYTSQEGYAAFVSRYGYVVIILKTSSTFCRNYVSLKGQRFTVAFI